MAVASVASIRAQVAVLRRRFPDARVLGLRVTPLPELGPVLRVDGEELPVARCESVLAVRERLATLDELGPPLILLTPLNESDLGLDVTTRLARRQLVAIEPWQLVKERFGHAKYVDPRLSERHAWVRDLLIEAEPENGWPPAPSGFLDAETVWRSLFEVLLDLPDGARDPESLLEWSLDAGHRERLARLPDDVRAGMRRAVGESAGAAAGRIFECLAGPNAAHAISIGLVSRVVHAPDASADAEATRAAVRMERFHGDVPLEAAEARAWADAAEAVVRRHLESSGVAAVRPVLDAADAFLERELLAPGCAHRSLLLPRSLEQRLGRFAESLGSNVESGAPSVEALWDVASFVSAHALARSDPARMERLDMSLRVAGWLAAERSARRPGSFADATRRYRAEDGFVDWARTRVWQGDVLDALTNAMTSLARAVDDAREEGNRSFGRLAASWCKSGSPDASLLLVEEVLDRLVAPIARLHPVLVVVIDGMGVAVHRELQADLTRRSFAEVVGDETQSSIPTRTPVIAAFPTVTQVSRTSLLCGRLTTGAQPQEKEGFTRHPSLVSASEPTRPPVLFHKAQLSETGTSGVAPDLLAEVLDLHRRIVGVVLNGVDDHLAKGELVRVDWTAQTIRPLAELLDRARDAGRAVVLVSDHGHVFEHGSTMRAGEGERWREPTASLEGDEVLLEGPRVLLGSGRRVVAPWSERVRFGQKKTGYHGGVSPQEVVIPLGVYLPSGISVKGLVEAPPELPEWWDRPEAAFEGRQPEPRRTTRPTPPSKPGEQGRLFPPAGSAPEPEPVRVVDWIDRLLASELLAQQRALAPRTPLPDERLRTLLLLLDERGGKLTRAALARRLGVAPLRVGAIVSAVRRLLNLEGYPVLSIDESSDTVELNRELLFRQFGLTRA